MRVMRWPDFPLWVLRHLWVSFAEAVLLNIGEFDASCGSGREVGGRTNQLLNMPTQLDASLPLYNLYISSPNPSLRATSTIFPSQVHRKPPTLLDPTRPSRSKAPLAAVSLSRCRSGARAVSAAFAVARRRRRAALLPHPNPLPAAANRPASPWP
jgi:hypothetical protein